MFRQRHRRPWLFWAAIAACQCVRMPSERWEHQLAVRVDQPRAQIEVGGPYVGIEAHHCSPTLSRISFFYPVANSIDNSEDYWQRDRSQVLLIAARVGREHPHLLGQSPLPSTLTPYGVTFFSQAEAWNLSVSFAFCRSAPAMVASFELVNTLPRPEWFELRTHLEGSLRTSHSYRRKELAWSEYWDEEATVFLTHDDQETGPAQIFVSNGAARPSAFTTDAAELACQASGPASTWLDCLESLSGTLLEPGRPAAPVVALLYRKRLQPHESLRVVQLIGSCRPDEGKELVRQLRRTYPEQVAAYRRFVLEKAFRDTRLLFADESLLHSAQWAKAVMAANAHFLAGRILPMPCPAEYNFFFTHDALLTDMARCLVDIAAVKEELEFIATLADSLGTIPHAYYWRDGRFVTEHAGADNWNHLWFIMVTARYWRHSADLATLHRLFPLVRRSLHLVLTHLHPDGTIWAYRPDWWDIGSNYGPRAYMTILTATALREYLPLAMAVGKHESLAQYEMLASRLQDALNDRLWDQQAGFLTNYLEDGSQDPHFYIGSLLAVHWGLLPKERAELLVRSARNHLADPALGVLNASPVDFHLWITRLWFQGNEAGEPYRYLNGGIWAHGNAWYALALRGVGAAQEAFNFLKTTMTVAGVAASPHGQPAMYEYRYSNPTDTLRYGEIDKPQFLWAAGWYLYSLYTLFGVTENQWNVMLDPFLPKGESSFTAELFVRGRKVTVTIRGQGPLIRRILFDGIPYPSAVVPSTCPLRKGVEVELGPPLGPYVARSNSTVVSAALAQRAQRLRIRLKAFAEHKNTTEIVSPWPAQEVLVNGGSPVDWQCTRLGQAFRVTFSFQHRAEEETVDVLFQGQRTK